MTRPLEDLTTDVPAALAGPGTIAQRQTTYWDLIATSGARYRVHFRDKAEAVFAGPAYASVELLASHPLLVQYDAPLRSLYFTSAPGRPREVAEAIDGAIRDVSSAWRSLTDYGTSIDAAERALGAGHGMLMNAPEPVCAVAAEVLERAGVPSSILGHAPARPGYRVLLLDRSYVIASGFAFDRVG